MFGEDLSAFFPEFGEPCTVDGQDLPSGAIFGDPWAEGELVDGNRPAITCIDAELPGTLSQQSTAVIRSKTFNVIDINPDGTGITLLKLEYVSG